MMCQITCIFRNSLLLFTALSLTACATWVPAPPDVARPTSTTSTAPLTTPSQGIVLAWSTSLDAEINWAPSLLLLADRTLVIVASEAGHVLALEPDTGAEVWRFTPPAQLWTDSVTVADDAVFVATEGAQVYLLDGLTGSIRWQTSVQPPSEAVLTGLEARSKPAFANNTLYIPTAGLGSRAKVTNPQISAPLVAVDFESGMEQWRFESGNYILRAPFVNQASERIVVGGNYLSEQDIDEGGPMRIHSLDLASGKPVWTFETLDGLVKSMWADENVVAYVAYRDFLVGLNARAGTELYRHNTGNWVQSFTVFPTLPTIPDPTLVYGSANAFLNAVNPTNGDFVWRHNIEGTFNYPIGNAVLADDTVYFITQLGDIQALNAADGTLRWQHDSGLEIRDGIAVGAGYLFVGSVDGFVYGYRLY